MQSSHSLAHVPKSFRTDPQLFSITIYFFLGIFVHRKIKINPGMELADSKKERVRLNLTREYYLLARDANVVGVLSER